MTSTAIIAANGPARPRPTLRQPSGNSCRNASSPSRSPPMSHSIRRALAAVVLGAPLAPAFSRAQSDPRDWPAYNHDALGTRHNPAERTLGKENAGRKLVALDAAS